MSKHLESANLESALRDYPTRHKRKAAKLSTICDELAIDGVDYVSIKTLSASLLALGWSKSFDGRQRLWIAPGESAISSGVKKPSNLRFIIGQAVAAAIAYVDRIAVSDLHDAVRRQAGDKVDVGIINRAMELRVRRGEWGYQRDSEAGNYWVRRKSAASTASTANDKAI